jgi:hypothetical protein
MCGPWKAASDIVLQPEIGEFAYDDFVRAPDLIRCGEVAARAAMPEIRAWMPMPVVVAAPVPQTAFDATMVPQPEWQPAPQPSPLKT